MRALTNILIKSYCNSLELRRCEQYRNAWQGFNSFGLLALGIFMVALCENKIDSRRKIKTILTEHIYIYIYRSNQSLIDEHKKWNTILIWCAHNGVVSILFVYHLSFQIVRITHKDWNRLSAMHIIFNGELIDAFLNWFIW